MKKIIIVLAGNKKQAQEYIKNSNDNSFGFEWVYAESIDKIRGLEVFDVKVVGTFWQDKKDAEKMWNLAQSRKRQMLGKL